MAEGLHRVADGALDDVISENHADLLAVGEMLGQGQRIGDAAFPLLICVVEVIEAELLAVGEQAKEISGIAPTGDQQNVANSRLDQRLDRVIDHRLVVDGEKMFVGDFRQRVQTAPRSARQNNAFHSDLSLVMSSS